MNANMTEQMEQQEQDYRVGRVAELEERLADLEERLETARTHERETAQVLAQRMVDGAEGEEMLDNATKALRAHRRDLQDTIRDLETSIPLIRQRIAKERLKYSRVLLEQFGRERLMPAAGGLRGEAPRHVQRAVEWEGKARAARQAAQVSEHRADTFADVSMVFRMLLGLSVPEILREGPATSRIWDRFSVGDHPGVLQETITALEEDPLADTEVVDALRLVVSNANVSNQAAVQKQRNAQRVAEGQKARDQVDEWLRNSLKDGPRRSDEVTEAARRQGIPAQRDPVDADLNAARRRLGVLALHRVGDNNRAPVWWGLPDGWDEEQFQALGIDPISKFLG